VYFCISGQGVQRNFGKLLSVPWEKKRLRSTDIGLCLRYYVTIASHSYFSQCAEYEDTTNSDPYGHCRCQQWWLE